MVILRPHTPRLFAASGGLLALLFFSIGWLGLPPFRIGYWNAEPVECGMLACGALVGLWLALGLALRWIDVRIPRRNLLLNLWLAWLGWQALATAFAQSPWRSWFGPPEQAEGLAWYLCASLLMLLLSALWPSARFRKILFSYGLLLMLALAVLHLVSDELNNMFAGFFFPPIPKDYFINWLPFVWPDYLGFVVAWWWIALMLTYPALRLRWLALLFPVLLLVLIASSNHGAIALVSYAMLVTFAARLMPARGLPYFRSVSKAWRVMASAALLLPVAWLLASPYVPARYSGDVSQSVPTRILLGHITMTALADEPSRLLLGTGWGHFADDFFKYSLVRDVRIYDDGKHQPNWPMVRGYNYHSHNMAGETLLSLGLIGFLLWFTMPLVVVRRLPPVDFWGAVPMLVASVLLSQVWFAMPQSMPFQALCWMLFITRMGAKESRPLGKIAPCAALAAAAALAWSASAQWEAMRYSALLTDPFGQRYGATFTAKDMEADIARGGDRLRTFFISYTKRLAANEEVVQPKHAELYREYLRAMEKLSADPQTGAYNGAAVLYGNNVLISSLRNPLFRDVRREAVAHYPAMAMLHTGRAPKREDIIAPFLQAIFDAPDDRDHQKLMAVVQELLAINPAHRSALWLGGKVLSTQPGFERQGRDMMQAALELGADRVFLIPEKEIKKLHLK